MSAGCDQCGIVTTAPELLTPVRGQRLCPPCADQRQAVEARRLGRLMLCAGLSGLLLLAVGQPVGWLLLNLGVLLPCALYVSVAVHELAHALAAIVLGLRLRGIALGHGPLLLSLGALDLRALPLAGFTSAGGRGAALGPRTALFLAAGPAANLLLLIGLVPGLRADVPARLAAGPAPGLLLAAASALSLLLSLWPTRARQGDGPAILAALRGGAVWLAGHERAEQRHDAELALARGAWPEARALFEALLAAPETGEARWWDMLGLAQCLLHELGDLPRADALSAEAVAAMPWEPLAQSTRALVQSAIAAGHA